MGAMSGEARAFLDDLPDPFLAWRGQDGGKPPGLSWATDPATAEVFARGNRGMENRLPTVYSTRVAKADVAFACADHSERGVTLRRPPAGWKTTTTTTLGFDPTIVKRKRGRPSKAELDRAKAKLDRDTAYAEYLERITTGCRRPEIGRWSNGIVGAVPKSEMWGDLMTWTLALHLTSNLRRSSSSASLAMRRGCSEFEKDRYRMRPNAGRYVPARECDELLEKILAQLLPEFLRLGSNLGDRFGKKFLDQVEALKQMVNDEDDSVCLWDDRSDDDRWKFKQQIMTRERNLDQIILDRKRIMKEHKTPKNRRKPAS